MIAASASGWAACWITEWPAYNADVARALGLSARETHCRLHLSRHRPRKAGRARAAGHDEESPPLERHAALSTAFVSFTLEQRPCALSVLSMSCSPSPPR